MMTVEPVMVLLSETRLQLVLQILEAEQLLQLLVYCKNRRYLMLTSVDFTYAGITGSGGVTVDQWYCWRRCYNQ